MVPIGLLERKRVCPSVYALLSKVENLSLEFDVPSVSESGCLVLDGFFLLPFRFELRFEVVVGVVVIQSPSSAQEAA